MKKKNEQKIDFADKYVYGSNYSDKFDHLRGYKKKKEKNPKRRARAQKIGTVLPVVLGAVALMMVGFFVMSVHMRSGKADFTPRPTDTQETTTSAPEQPSAAVEEPIEFQAKLLDAMVLDGSAAISAAISSTLDGGFNAAVFDLKRQDGTLAYQSSLPESELFGTVASPAANVQQSVQSMKDGGVLPIARVHCFEDPLASGNSDYGVLTAEESALWTDENGKTWLNPYSTAARSYVINVVKEIHAMGIDIVMLDGLKYPDGDLANAYFAYDIVGNPSDIVLSSFIKQIKKEVPGVRVLTTATFNFENSTDFAGEMVGFYERYDAATAVPIITTQLDETTVRQLLEADDINTYVVSAATQ